MLNQAVGEQKVVNLLCGGLGLGDGGQVGRSLGHGVALLYQCAAQHGAELDGGGFHAAALQDNTVLLGLQYSQRLFCV